VASTSAGAGVEQGACSCRVAGSRGRGLEGLALGGLGLAALALGHRRRRARR
jgi:hypothetical protein